MKALVESVVVDNPWLLAFLLGFVAIFAGLSLRLFLPGLRAQLKTEERLPLED